MLAPSSTDPFLKANGGLAGGNAAGIGMESSSLVFVFLREGNTIEFSGLNPFPNASGTFNPSTLRFTPNETDRVLGINGVSVDFSGTLTTGDGGRLGGSNGILSLGDDGKLPGRARVVYTVSGTPK